MQKLSTVFWLFICVKLLCKITRKKSERKKKIRETTASFVLIFGLKKQVQFQEEENLWKKAYCFDFSVCLKNQCKSKKKQKIRENTAVFVLIFRYDWKTSEKVVKMRKFRLLFVFGVVLQLTPTSGRTTLFLFCILYYSKY